MATLVNFNEINFHDKILKYQISWKSAQWEPSCPTRTDALTDRRAEMTNLTVAFRNFANSPKYLILYLCLTISQVTHAQTRKRTRTHTPRHTHTHKLQKPGLSAPTSKTNHRIHRITKISFTSIPIFPSHSLNKYRDITLSDNCR